MTCRESWVEKAASPTGGVFVDEPRLRTHRVAKNGSPSTTPITDCMRWQCATFSLRARYNPNPPGTSPEDMEATEDLHPKHILCNGRRRERWNCAGAEGDISVAQYLFCDSLIAPVDPRQAKCRQIGQWIKKCTFKVRCC
jgi:hypothetical protein